MNSQKFVGVMLLSDSFCGFFFLCLQFRGMESTIDHWGCLTKASRQAISINISQGDLVEKEVQSSMVISPMGRFGIILVRLVPCLSSFVGGAGLQVPLLCFTGKSCRAFPTSWHGSCLSQKKASHFMLVKASSCVGHMPYHLFRSSFQFIPNRQYESQLKLAKCPFSHSISSTPVGTRRTTKALILGDESDDEK